MVTKRKTFYQNDYHENNNNNKIEFALKRAFFSCPIVLNFILSSALYPLCHNPEPNKRGKL